MHAECYPNWGLDGPKLWVLTRLWWDPSQDPQALTREFCRDMFGPGAAGMAAYFETLEKFWDKINVVDGPERKLNRWGTQFKSTAESRALLAHARMALEEALKEPMTAAERGRAEFFSDCFGMTERFFALAAKETVTEADLKEGEAYIQGKVFGHPLSLHQKELTLPAWREVYWARLKAADRKLTVPYGAPKDGTWSHAVTAGDWTVKGADKDPQGTRAEILADEKTLYLRVTCPKQDMETILEVDDDGWRSDNVELFFGPDGDKGTFERQMWVKTNGRVVDYSGREKPNREIKGKVTKGPAGYVVEIAVPLTYARPSGVGNAVGMMVVRNEFVRVGGMNEQKYGASWNGTLRLGQKGISGRESKGGRGWEELPNRVLKEAREDD